MNRFGRSGLVGLVWYFGILPLPSSTPHMKFKFGMQAYFNHTKRNMRKYGYKFDSKANPMWWWLGLSLARIGVRGYGFG